MGDAHTIPEPTGLAPEQPTEITISMTDDVFIKQIAIPRAGTLVPQHSHAFDHTSMLAVGAMRVWAEGAWLGDFVAPAPIVIRAGTRHTMMSLEDGTLFYCIHNTARAGVVEVLEQGEIAATAPAIEPDDAGFVVAEEPWPVFWRDGQALFAAHRASIGPDREGAPIEINAGIVDKLDAVGGVQIMTVRSNGRLFGYLAVLIGPSLESVGLVVGTATAFYVSPDAPGYGTKLLRAAIAGLRAKGVHELVLRAGTRGDGPRLGTLYQRLGAKPAGEMFSLMLREA